jgi:hypothetical protein
MPLTPSRGDMFPFVDATLNPVKGACWNILHGYGCKYCSIGIKGLGRGYYGGPFELYEKELQEKFLPNRVYFISSAIDLFHPKIPDEWIGRTLSHCDLWVKQTPGAMHPPKFIFQSKNPERMEKFIGEFPRTAILSTTYETDDMEVYGDTSRAPKPDERLEAMFSLADKGFDLMLSIEPIMKFRDVESFVEKIASVYDYSRSAMFPWNMISIGADSCEALPLEKQPDIRFITNLATRLSEARSVQRVIIKENCLNLTNAGSASSYLGCWKANGWIYERKPAKERKIEQGELF